MPFPQFKDALNSDALSLFKRDPVQETINSKALSSGLNKELDDPKKFTGITYKTEYNYWYKALPYGFRFRDRSGKDNIIFLPISPQNLTVTTHFATNVITSLYGTIEEHSEQRYFDIMIEGTTGISPKYTEVYKPSEVGSNSFRETVSNGRASYGDAVGGTVNSGFLGGFLKKQIDTVNNAVQNITSTVLGKGKFNKSGIDIEKTGYAAFHKLYKFFLVYKADTSGERTINNNPRSRRRKGLDGTAHPLTFLNYKDNVQYDVSIQRFSLKRDTSNPMLYKYSIVLRGYNLKQANRTFSDNELQDRAESLGLDGPSSTFMSASRNASNSLKNVLGSAGSLGGF